MKPDDVLGVLGVLGVLKVMVWMQVSKQGNGRHVTLLRGR